MDIISHTREVLRTVANKNSRIVLFYSGGKDSICLLDFCSQYFDEVVCVFMYFVKDLEHINRYIRFSEAKYSNVRFIQVPHWNLTYIIRSGNYCVANPMVKLMKLADVNESIRIQTGITWTAYGMKLADSMNRRLMLRGYDLDAINSSTQNCYPLSHWKDAEVLRYIQAKGLPSPVNYGTKKRSSGLGFDTDVFVWLRENEPNDLEKILAQFPQSERILFEYDYKQKNKSQF